MKTADLFHAGPLAATNQTAAAPLARMRSAQRESLRGARIRLRQRERLFRPRDACRFLYTVRYGFFKSTVMIEDGRDQVTAFHLEGDLIGLDGIGSGMHTCEVTALEDSEVVATPYVPSDESAASPMLSHAIHQAMSREINRENSMLMMLGSMYAEQRMAAFLSSLSSRLKTRGYSRTEFVLRMTRAEIGSFLGLTLETVSRCFSRLARERVIEVNQRYVRIIDADALSALISNASERAARARPGAEFAQLV